MGEGKDQLEWKDSNSMNGSKKDESLADLEKENVHFLIALIGQNYFKF